MQYALPKILKETPREFFEEYSEKLAEASEDVYKRLSEIGCDGGGVIQPIRATAGMYMMVRINIERFKEESGVKDDTSFVLKIWEDEAVLLLPSSCFA